MKLAEYQRTVMRVMLSSEPTEQDLGVLGQEPRWQIYRHMVRTRIKDMAQKAFKQTHALIGDATFAAAFASYLERASPKSPLIRDVVAAFAAYLEEGSALDGAPRCARDMLRFERARWEVAYQQATPATLGEHGVRELDFEGALVVNPVLRVLVLEHPVHREEAAWHRPEATHLLVYRTNGAGEIRWWATTALFALLLTRAQHFASESLADAVRSSANERGLLLDQALLESLSDDLTLGLQRNVVIGVR